MQPNKIIALAALICLASWIRPDATLSQPLTDSTVNFFTLTDYYDHYFDSLIQFRGAENMQGTGYKDYLRWKWFNNGRHGDNGDLGEMWECIADYHENFRLPQGYSDYSDWQFIGPLGIPLGHDGAPRNGTGKGMMLSIWVSEGDHSLMYAGSHHSGLWKTADGGENWYPLHDNDARIHGVNSIAVDPQDHNTIYVTSGNSINSYSHYADGVFKSRDGGESWEQLIIDGMELPTGYWGARLRKILIHPRHSNLLYFTTYNNVFMSEDGGEQWNTIFHKAYFPWPDTDSTTFDKHNGMFDFEIDSMNDSLYYLAGSEIFMIKDSLNVFDTINLSEEIFHIGLQSGDSILNHPSRAAIDVDSHFPGIAWFSYIADYKKDGYDSSTFLRIVKFSSLDTTFELVFDKKSNGGFSADKFVFEVAHIDTSSVIFYIGGLGIGKIDPEYYPDSILTISAGAYPGPCWVHVDMRDIQLLSDGNGNDTLFLANDAGISWGTPFEQGQTGCGNGIWHWEYLGKSLQNGLDVTEFYGIGISDQQPDLIAGGCQDLNDMLLYNDEWINFGGGDGSEIVFDPDYSNIFYFSEWQSSTLFRTNTYGKIYDTRGFFSMTESTMFMPIELDPNNSSILYSGGKDLLKFTNVNDFLHDVPQPAELEHFNNNITDIEINP